MKKDEKQTKQKDKNTKEKKSNNDNQSDDQQELTESKIIIKEEHPEAMEHNREEMKKEHGDKHVILSMADIKDHEAEQKQKNTVSKKFIEKRKSMEINEYPSLKQLKKIDDENEQINFF